MFSINDDSTIGGPTGFKIEFPNKHTVSVIWGKGASCDKTSAEVAIIKPDGSFYPLGGQDTWAWRTPKEVAQLVFFASML
jgi:hypothetical protein